MPSPTICRQSGGLTVQDAVTHAISIGVALTIDVKRHDLQNTRGPPQLCEERQGLLIGRLKFR